jgi:hypothetical protein
LRLPYESAIINEEGRAKDMPDKEEGRTQMAPLDVPRGLKDAVVRRAKRERLSAAELARRILAKGVGYKFKKED